MIVRVQWTTIRDYADPGWRIDCGLYAYCTVGGSEILYIGKVDGTTVRRRWARCGKEDFWHDLERERRIFHHCVLVGEVALWPGLRLTRSVLADVESLLINRIQPWGNIQCQVARISRPGLRVLCAGEWPFPTREYHDD